MDPVDELGATVRVQAGAVTEAVHRHCEPHGLTWPVDFASKGSSHVGGNIATNAGAEGSIVVAKVKEMKPDEGFNAATDTYEDLVKAGVIDPAKVVRSALQNSSSIASLLLTTEALVSEIPEEKKARAIAIEAEPAKPALAH